MLALLTTAAMAQNDSTNQIPIQMESVSPNIIVKDNVTIYKGLEKTFYGATEFSIIDINNYVLTFAENED